jgi:hypothetical protein
MDAPRTRDDRGYGFRARSRAPWHDQDKRATVIRTTPADEFNQSDH